MIRKYTHNLCTIGITVLLLNLISNTNPLLAQENLEQFTNVNQLRDVSPTDWTYDALKNLTDNYDCLTGYSDETFRGDRSLTRQEYAFTLDICLNYLSSAISNGSGIALDLEELEQIRRLTNEFQAELTPLGNRVNNLENNIASLEDHQFSTRTKLGGDVIFVGVATDDEEVTLSTKIRINLNTTFTGDNNIDNLRIRLQAGNNPDLSTFTGSDMSRLAFFSNSNNNIGLNEARYQFSFGGNINNDNKKEEYRGMMFIGATGLDIDEIFDVGNPQLYSTATGAFNRFFRIDPLLFRGSEGTGTGLRYRFNDNFQASALYLTNPSQASNPNDGFFSSNYTTGVQLLYSPITDLDLGFVYKHDYFQQGSVNLISSTGSAFGKDPSQGLSSFSQDIFGIHGDWESDNFQIGGSFSYAFANAEELANSSVDISSWQIHTSLLNLGREDAALTFAFGQPPRINSVDGNLPLDENTSYILETQYLYPLNNHVSITPGFYMIFNPNHNNSNDNIYIGSLRMKFGF